MGQPTKKEYLDKIETIIDKRTTVSNRIDDQQKRLVAAKEKNELVKEIFKKEKTLFNAIPEAAFNNPDPPLASFLGTAAPIIENEYDFSDGLYNRATDFKTIGHFVYQVATGASNAMVIDDLSDAYYDTQKYKPELKAIEQEYISRSPIERKEEIANRLALEVSPKIKDMFILAWQSFLNESNQRGFILTAHAMREVLSEFLLLLAPDEKVRQKDWCELDQNKPTQRTRVRFAIFGNKEHDENDLSFRPIKNLMDIERDLYQKKLNPYAHYRKDRLPLNCRADLKNYLTVLQDTMEAILDKRKVYYEE